jgi:hypothetical protein
VWYDRWRADERWKMRARYLNRARLNSILNVNGQVGSSPEKASLPTSLFSARVTLRIFFSLSLLALVGLLRAAQPPVSLASGLSSALHSSGEDARLWHPSTNARRLTTLLEGSPTPEPAETPTPVFASYFPARLGSKLSLHFIRNTPASYQFLRDTTPPLIKLASDVGWSSTVRHDFPSMLIIGRLSPENRTELAQMDPVRAANKYVTDLLPEYRANPHVDYWEGWNEFDPRTPDQWNWFVQFEGQRACLMRHYGYQTVIGNFSTGRPEFNEMLMFLPAIRIGLKCGAILGLHEYSAPSMQFGYQLAIPHRPAFSDRGLLTFRYRFWYEDILKPLNLPIPLVITEMGVDGGVGGGRPGPSGVGGWLDFTRYWQDQGWGGDGAGVYTSQLAWYDSEMRKDPYVIGATIFTAGRPGGWESFNVENLIPSLTSYVAGMRNR